MFYNLQNFLRVCNMLRYSLYYVIQICVSAVRYTNVKGIVHAKYIYCIIRDKVYDRERVYIHTKYMVGRGCTFILSIL